MHLSSPKTKETSLSPFLSTEAYNAGKQEKNGAKKVHQLMLRVSNDALGRTDPSRRSVPSLRGKCPHSVNQRDLPLDTRVGARCYPNQGRGVDVFVLYSGCQPSHAVFAGTDLRTMALPMSPIPASGLEDHGHGCHVAGTVAGSMKGVAPRERITFINVLNSENRGKFSFLVSAFEYAVAFKAANPDRKAIVQASIGDKSVNLCTPARDDLYLSRSHPRANHRPMIWMDQLHARFGVVPRRNGGEIAYCAPSVWLCVIALAGRYPSVACVHLAPLRAGVAWVACLAGLARVRARVRVY